MKEVWRKCEYSGYLVSNMGRVKNLNKHKNAKTFVKPHRTSKGYCRAHLKHTNNRMKSVFVHRLIAKAFCPNYRNGLQVNHINGIKHDNRAVNLEWVTASENKIHSYHVLGNKVFGEETSQAKLTNDSVLKIRQLARDGVPQSGLSLIFQISQPNICSIINRKTWTHI